MSNIAKKLLKPAIVGMLAASGLLLSGCGTGNGGSGMDSASSISSTTSAATRSVTISGGAVKGVVQNGIVTAWEISEDAHGHWATSQQMGKAVRTNSRGQFQLPVLTKLNGWVVIELKADDRTTMVCDVTPSCDVNGSQVPFGQAFPLSSSFELSAAVDLSSTSPQVYLTPLSQLAVSLAQRSPEGLSGSNLKSAYSQVENWFGLNAGTLQLAPPDLTHLNSATTSTDAIQLAVTNAAFLALVNQSGWSSIEQVLQTASNQILQNGDLTTTSGSTSSAVTISQLEMETAVLAASLQSTTTDTLAQQSLAVTQSRASQLYVSAPTSSGSSTTGSTTTSTDTGSSSSTSSTTTTITNTGSSSTGSSVAVDSALLQWQAPSTREDGTSLSMAELKGYEIDYGQDPSNLNQTMTINDAYTMSATIANLSSGQWYFAVKAIDTNGNISPMSSVVTKTI